MAGIVQIGKRRWLAGMAWASYEDTPSKAALREDALRFNSTWAAVRIGDDCIQSGFCSAIEGVKTNQLYSLAAILADSRRQPWLGTFRIDEDRWWYIAVRDGHAILPDGDVLGGVDEIYAARERHSGFTDWNYVEGDASLLEEMIAGVDAPPTRIQSLNRNPNLPKLLAGAAVGVATLMGGGYWWLLQEQEAARQRAAMERMRAQLAHSAPVAAPVAVTPATTLPYPTDVLRACGNALDLPISRFGWVIDNVSCSATHASVEWVRKDGATVEFRPEGQLAADGEKVTQAISLGLAQQSADDRIQLDDVAQRLRAWSQAAGFKLNLNTETRAPVVLPGATKVPTPQPSSIETSVTINTSVSPFDLDLNNFPGLRLKSVRVTTNGWELTGVLYGR